MRRWIFLIALLLCAGRAQAQVTVTGTVTDASAQAYANGTYQFTFATAPGIPSGYTFNGAPFPVSTTYTGNLDSSGAFSQAMAPNNQITPSGSQWIVRFCPLADAPCYQTKLAINGAGSITSSITPPTIAVPASLLNQPKAYADSEITSPVVGFVYYNLTSGALRVCTVSVPCTWAGVGSGSAGTVGNGASPIIGYYLSPNCPATLGADLACYQTPANTKIDNTCSWATSGPTVTCTDAPFTAAVTGMHAAGWATCQAFSSSLGTGAISNSADFTITFVSSTQVTLSSNPGANAASNACFMYGTPDDTGTAALDTAVSAVTANCPKVFLAAANYWWTAPHFVTNPPGCISNPAQVNHAGAGGAGNVFYAAGFSIEGRGRANTYVFLSPSFPGAGACTNGGPSGTANACLVRVLEGEWRDFQISGGGNMAAPNIAGKALIEFVGPGSTDNFLCTNMGGNSGTGFNSTIGFEAFQWESWRQVDNSGCGTIGVSILAGSTVFANELRVENSSQIGISVTGPYGGQTPNLSCMDCGVYLPITAPSDTTSTEYGVFNTLGASVLFYGGRSNIQNSSTTAVNPQVGYFNNSSGGVGTFYNTVFDMQHGANGASAIKQGVAGTVILQQSVLASTAGGFTYKDVAGSTLTSLGRNVFLENTLSLAGSTSQYYIAPTDIFAAGVTGLAPTCTFTSGGGTSPSCALQAGSTNEKGVIIATTGTGSPGTTGTVTLTFEGTFTGGVATTPACNFNPDDSGTAWGNGAITKVSTQSSTAPIVAWSNSAANVLTALAVSSPYRIDYTCTPR